MEDERRARARRRAELRRRQVRRARMILALAILVVVILLVLIISKIAAPGKKKNTGNAGDNTAVSVQEGSASQEAQDGEDAPDGADDENAAGIGEAASQDTGTDSQAVMAQAARLADMYDYDGAISLLEGQAASDSDAAKAIELYQQQKNACVAVDVTTIPHVFFHSLINDDRAFKADLVGADRVRQNNAAMTTTYEFDVMMQQMYDAGYVLVGLDDMCVKTTGSDGLVHIQKNSSLMLPPDKKAFVLSVDDLSYYHTYGIGTQGYATRMLVDGDGKPKCEYTDENGQTTIGDYDVVPRLDSFIEQHPDFCYRGARGTVAMTGYNGVFGYRTNDYYKNINDEHLDYDQVQWLQEHPDFNWEEDCANAKAVADAMKAEGWTFASHTYGHLNAESNGLASLQHDNERWMTVNHPILGDIDKIIFAFGADIGYVGEYTDYNEKFQYFKSQGYNIFCNVDGNVGWTEFGDTFMRTGRVALDGFTMYQAMTDTAAAHTIYAKAYDVLGIHDVPTFFNPLRPTPIDSE